jgi:hypothetical protein
MKPSFWASALLLSLACRLNASAAGSLYLLEEPSARARAAGGAWTAGQDGVEAMRFNPSGLAWQKDWELAFARANESDEWTHNWVAVAGTWQGTGLGMEYLNSSVLPVKLFDSLGNEAGDAGVGAQSLALGASHALFQENLGLGISVKMFRGEMAGYSNLGGAMDVGTQYRFKKWPVAIGLSAQNLGWQSAYISQPDALPNGLRAGVKARLLETSGLKLDGMFDALRFPGVSTVDRFRAGAELGYQGLAFASAGVQNSVLGNTYSFGGGVNLYGLGLAYAVQTGYFPGLTQLLSLTYSPSQNPSKARP